MVRLLTRTWILQKGVRRIQPPYVPKFRNQPASPSSKNLRMLLHPCTFLEMSLIFAPSKNHVTSYPASAGDNGKTRNQTRRFETNQFATLHLCALPDIGIAIETSKRFRHCALPSPLQPHASSVSSYTEPSPGLSPQSQPRPP